MTKQLLQRAMDALTGALDDDASHQKVIAELRAAIAKPEVEPVAAANKDAVLQASIDFIRELTGMEPPPIEVAPPETFQPFKTFADKVCAIFATPQAAAQPEPYGYHSPKTGKVYASTEAASMAMAGEVKTVYLATQAQPSQALELSDDEIDALLPTITLKGLDPKQQVWLTKKDAIAFARAIIAAINAKGAALRDGKSTSRTKWGCIVTKDEIQAEWDAFISYPEGSGNLYVTTTSALIFARSIVEMAEKRGRDKLRTQNQALVKEMRHIAGISNGQVKRVADQALAAAAIGEAI